VTVNPDIVDVYTN